VLAGGVVSSYSNTQTYNYITYYMYYYGIYAGNDIDFDIIKFGNDPGAIVWRGSVAAGIANAYSSSYDGDRVVFEMRGTGSGKNLNLQTGKLFCSGINSSKAIFSQDIILSSSRIDDNPNSATTSNLRRKTFSTTAASGTSTLTSITVGDRIHFHSGANVRNFSIGSVGNTGDRSTFMLTNPAGTININLTTAGHLFDSTNASWSGKSGISLNYPGTVEITKFGSNRWTAWEIDRRGFSGDINFYDNDQLGHFVTIRNGIITSWAIV
jgi:hypothetical protein